MNRLETERLVLRRFTPDDAAFIQRLYNEPSFLRFIGDRGVRTEADAREYLVKRLIVSYSRFGFGLCLVESKAEATALGICGLIKRDTLPDVDIGYAFVPEFWGKGYALEAAAATLAYGREVARLKRLVAIVSPDNARSIHLLNKLGLLFERTLIWPDDGTEVNVYGIEF